MGAEGEGESLLVAINHTVEPLDETIRPARLPAQVVEVERDEEVALRDGGFPVSLGPQGVRVYNVRRHTALVM